LVIVDSSVLVDYLNGLTNPETEWLDLRLDRERLGLTSITIVEVLQGVRDERAASAVESVLDEFELITVPDPRTAIDAARNYRRLRAEGRTIRNTIDLLIATHCIRHGHSLLHRDRDFDPFESLLGLMVIRP
jgi:predicted nucleic acid-binding protein